MLQARLTSVDSMCSRVLSVFYLTVLSCASGSRILAVAPMPALSHFQFMAPLFEELVTRGHDVTVVSHMKAPSNANYTNIDLTGIISSYELNFDVYNNIVVDVYEMFTFGVESCNTVLASEPVQTLLHSNQSFDLVFIEAFDCDALLGFPAFYNAPYIAFSPMVISTWLSDWVANPSESYIPNHWCREAGVSMPARGRKFLCEMILHSMHWWYGVGPGVQSVQTHFGLNMTSLAGFKASASAIFLNTIPTLSGIRPYLPNIIEVGGMHTKPQKLPKELKAWMDDCESGVIVFSMGSIVKASTLEPSIREAIVSVLLELQECVLWKWEQELPGLPQRIRTVSWLPQASALDHKNVKMFIAHGGVHGLMETIKSGVPVLGMPLFGDQMTNLQMLQEEGAAISMPLQPFDVYNFRSSINAILTNPSYRENALRLSRIMTDVERTPLQKAVWWTEYIIRHKGAHHLRHKGLSLTWWQRKNLDLYLTFGASLLLGYVILRFFRRRF